MTARVECSEDDEIRVVGPVNEDTATCVATEE